MSPVERVMRIVVGLLLIAASSDAQTRADFSGRWQLVPDPSAPTAGARSVQPMGTGWGNDITIKQEPNALTIEFATYGRGDMQPPTRLVYRLDGSESTNSTNVGRGPQDQVSKAAWDGAKLTLTTVRSFTAAAGEKPMTVQTTHTLSLDTPGTLVVETTHSAALGGKSSTSRTTYKKS